MRLLMGLLSTSPFATALTGDASLAHRPMERVAEPLRRMGADVRTSDGRPPVTVRGSSLVGIDFTSPAPSAQVKSAVLLAGVAASGVTTVRESVPTRDHTERALQALGVPIDLRSGTASVRRFQHEGFTGSVPGDPSTAAFLVAAAALTGSPLEIHGVALNPTRTHFLEVLGRMGVRTESRIEDHELGEPVGSLFVAPCDGLTSVRVESHELPLVVDEVPVLAAVAAHAPGDSRFLGAEELRLKESDRLRAIAAGIRELGGHAADEGMDLIVAGGGLEGGRTDARGDHRIALSLAVAALAARAPCEIDGFESADVSFPGAAGVIRELGGRVEVVG
jgi:3-phosphoshikimate 1-carboxyvinyltransferase